jgi:hypothetical protein
MSPARICKLCYVASGMLFLFCFPWWARSSADFRSIGVIVATAAVAMYFACRYGVTLMLSLGKTSTHIYDVENESNHVVIGQTGWRTIQITFGLALLVDVNVAMLIARQSISTATVLWIAMVGQQLIFAAGVSHVTFRQSYRRRTGRVITLLLLGIGATILASATLALGKSPTPIAGTTPFSDLAWRQSGPVWLLIAMSIARTLLREKDH